MITMGRLNIFFSFESETSPANEIAMSSVGGLELTPTTNNTVWLGQDFNGRPRAARKSWFDWLRPVFGVRPKTIEPQVTVAQFFAQIKTSLEDIEVITPYATAYERAIKKAQDAGQTALLEKLEDNLVVARAEALLSAKGYRKYVREETVVDFVQQAAIKPLRLDWIKHFTRPLPPEVAERLAAVRELKVFDNYVVLHYDPNKKSAELTRAEIAAKKDPILFGVIRGSTKLYYVTDWIDEHCDLTLSEIILKMGASAVKEL